MDSPIFDVPKFVRAEHEAIKNCWNGEATPDQQRLAIAVIVKKICEPQELKYIEGSFDGTAFLAGRGFVASKIRHLVNTKVSETEEGK